MTADCLCKRGSAWVGHFTNQRIDARPAVGDVVILASSDQVCYSRGCDRGTGIANGSKKVKVVRVFVKPLRLAHHSADEVYRLSVFGEEVP